MAPYVMKVELVNQTDQEVNWVGASTLSNLDGHTSVGSLNVGVGKSGYIPITKSGGTDGLFTTLSWRVGVHWDYKIKFCVYCEMPASLGSDVFVGMRDISFMSDPQFQSSSATDYNRDTGKQYKVFNNPVSKGGITVGMRLLKGEFPNSHVLITITQDINPQDIPSRMNLFEGSRVRSPDGAIYLVLNGLAHHIGNMDVFRGMFGDNMIWGDQSQEVVNAMPKGPALYDNPPLINPPEGGPVYLVVDGKKRHIANPDTFNRYGLDWGRIVHTDCGRYPDAPSISI